MLIYPFTTSVDKICPLTVIFKHNINKLYMLYKCATSDKKITSYIMTTTSSASLGNLSSSTNVGTVAKRNEYNKIKK